MATKMLAPAYMSAAEMKDVVRSLTGYEHPAFDVFADVLGRVRPETGARTTDRPSFLSVMFFQKIAVEVADSVLLRESEQDQAERLVFRGVDLSRAPDAVALDAFLTRIHAEWFGREIAPEDLAVLLGLFRESSAAHGIGAGYRDLIATLLQHGSLYFY